MKLLNLDEIAAPEVKSIKLKGKVHEAAEQTVGTFIEQSRRAKSLVAADDTVAGQFESAIAMLQEIFPSIERDDLMGLRVEMLTKLVKFAVATPEDLAKQAEAEATEAGNA